MKISVKTSKRMKYIARYAVGHDCRLSNISLAIYFDTYQYLTVTHVVVYFIVTGMSEMH